ncbi:MAG: hypothetical protein KGM39_00540 [Actinomycetales bacterium]|nr:hypothetical protein [Actinomycetales bacterium]
MISINKSLKTMQWANQGLFEDVSILPSEIYGLTAAEGEWPVGRLLTHFIGAAEWYRFCLTGIPYGNPEKITSSEVLFKSKSYLNELDQCMINESLKEDEVLTFANEVGQKNSYRSTILGQAVMHTAQHWGQIAAILKQHGHHLDLDKYDVWSLN